MRRRQKTKGSHSETTNLTEGQKNTRKAFNQATDDMERKQASHQKWWFPDQRPLAEPPILVFEKFEDEYVPSDKKQKKIFGEESDNTEAKTRHRDLETEVAMLEAYDDFAWNETRFHSDSWCKPPEYYRKGAATRASWDTIYNHLVAEDGCLVPVGGS